jgi:hypothetical protein
MEIEFQLLSIETCSKCPYSSIAKSIEAFFLARNSPNNHVTKPFFFYFFGFFVATLAIENAAVIVLGCWTLTSHWISNQSP